MLPCSVLQSVSYGRRGERTGTHDPNAPPPYSSHFTTPPYVEKDDTKDLPPAYANLGFDNAGGAESSNSSDAASHANPAENDGQEGAAQADESSSHSEAPANTLDKSSIDVTATGGQVTEAGATAASVNTENEVTVSSARSDVSSTSSASSSSAASSKRSSTSSSRRTNVVTPLNTSDV